MNAPTDAPVSPAPNVTLSGRLESLDAYRGLIMFTLLCGGIFHSLKGHPFWNWLYVQNEHVAWAGCVYWDLIQPSFMFMVGVAMPFAFQRRLQLGATPLQLLRHAWIRAFNLLAIGILLDHIGSDKIQIGFIRVLQQIAIGYVIAVVVVGRSLRTQGLLAAGILIGYQLLWMFNPWNGTGGPWAMGNENIGSVFDRWILGRNYSGHYVGLNAIPSAATIVLGVMAGTRIMTASSPRQVCKSLLLGAVGGIGFGLAVSPWFPLIKRIWTPSFAIYAAGWTTLFLLGFYWLIEVKQYRRWAFPLTVVGMNSIAAYVLGNAFGGWFRSATTAWIVWLKPILGDVAFPIFQRGLFAAAAWGVLYWLWKRKIFFKA